MATAMNGCKFCKDAQIGEWHCRNCGRCSKSIESQIVEMEIAERLEGILVSPDDIDVLDKLCAVHQDNPDEYVIMDDEKLRNELASKGFVAIDDGSKKCWGTTKLRRKIRGLRKLLESVEEKESEKNTIEQ